MPAHVCGREEVVLQPLPEQPRLSYPPDLMPPAHDPLAPVVIDKVTQGDYDFWLMLLQLFIVQTVVARALEL